MLVYVSEEDEDINVRNALLRIIPKYMVPTRYIRREALLYNDNGKIDRKKLREEYIERVSG